MRIAIVGNAGSGKSTFALELHKKLNIPLYHLDQYFWKPGWQEPDRSEFEKIHNALCDKPEWIIEGMAIRFAQYRFAKADVIIFLDEPRYKCFYRMFMRTYKYFGTAYFASAAECPQRGPDKKFLKFMWNFAYNQRPAIYNLLQQYAEKKVVYIVAGEAQKNNIVGRL